MIVTVHKCKKCDSEDLVFNGKNKSGSQTCKCKTCNSFFIFQSVKKTSNIDKDTLGKCFHERNSQCSIARIFGISPSTVGKWLKEVAQSLPAFKESIVPPSIDGDILEADEVWTFVKVKKNIRRVWIVMSRKTRQILSFFIGDGTIETCKNFWRKLPSEYQKMKSFSDFWKAYNCIPKETHEKVGKETGETAHIERLNNTVRQTFPRMVRKALSFSKKEYMLNLHFKLWAYNYNMDIMNKIIIS